ncbi:hypothetical protein FRC18_004475 [Serendipita sp. 400]|nr:hypothetical protein FRC18_004475 [Serendipita sp. 400]
MNHHYRFYPLPRPSLKTANRSSRGYSNYSSPCACSPPCNGDFCLNSNSGFASPTQQQPPSPHVHFLGLCQTYLVDYDYDRSSTVVERNDCALPARGCPGRTYFLNGVPHTNSRTGRRLGRCSTPAASRPSSRSRANNMSPPPSPSFYTKHIFYPDEYPFPSPIPSPRVVAPPLAHDPGLSPSASDDSDQSSAPYTPDPISPPAFYRRSSSSTSIANNGGSMQLFIDAPCHPPIPGLASMSPTSPRGGGAPDMFAIANALNGLELNGMELPKKVKSKKSKTSLSGTSPKRTKVAAAPTSWASDAGALGGF